MSFGPAPVKNEVKPADVKKPVPPVVRTEQPRAAAVPDIKKPVVKPPAPEAAKPAAKAELSAPQKQPAKADAKPDKKPEVKENVKLKEDVRPQKAAEPPLPAPQPYPGATDLGLPRLNLESPTGFLGQIPMVAKIGIVVVLLAGLGGLYRPLVEERQRGSHIEQSWHGGRGFGAPVGRWRLDHGLGRRSRRSPYPPDFHLAVLADLYRLSN